ncbi:acyl-CoA desaturase [Aquabacterium sp. A7-Y]|uniref:acyl-CoA desaturase n=1 Tax=Aquabacterium sp. A7-Y TaxID=1349605 RepID=UPI00223E16EE|nr:acyl-CoA desaturase [Aquabacterium sp. A7-Y]MCW7541932.1 acyl-CoA desaturase [Aquabacterium sp. A7-Y]
MTWDSRSTAALPPPPHASASAQAFAAGVTCLAGPARRLEQLAALTVLLLPAAGFGLALQLLLQGRCTALDLALFGLMYTLQMAGITMGFHRLLAHKAFRTSAALEAVLLVCGSMAAQGPLLFWVATHRRHHVYSDGPADPHSPRPRGSGALGSLRGLWHAHVGWMLGSDRARWSFFAADLLRERRLLFFHRSYPLWVLLGLGLPAAVGGLATADWDGAWRGLLFGGLARMFLANQAAWCVGSLCHRFGRRPFETGDCSANNWLVALITFGEGLQNNHHAFPGSFRHGLHWWEPDPAGWLLAAFGALGWVWDLRRPDAAAIERRRRHIANLGPAPGAPRVQAVFRHGRRSSNGRDRLVERRRAQVPEDASAAGREPGGR